MEGYKYRFQRSKLPGGVLTIIPLGDIQWAGRPEHVALRLLQETIDRGTKAGAYYVGMGDYIDFASPSNRRRLKNADLYDTAMDVIDQSADRLNDEIAEILKPTEGRWLGMLEGHHFYQFPEGDTSDMRLARKLRARHLGSSAYLGLILEDGLKHREVNIWCSHGQGGGNRSAAPVTKLESIVSAYEADIFLIGHMTKMAHSHSDRVYPSWRTKDFDLHHQDIHLVGTGGFSKGLIPNSRNGQVPRGSYVEQGMMKPTVLGAPIIRIEPIRCQKDGLDTLERRITVEM